jgi:hypothetical protein
LREGFTAQQAQALTGCTHHQLRYWDRVGSCHRRSRERAVAPGFDASTRSAISSPCGSFEASSTTGCRSSASGGRGTTCVATPTWTAHLAEVKLVTDGQTIFRIARDDGQLMDALREGQLAFFVAIDEITRTVEEDVSPLRTRPQPSSSRCCVGSRTTSPRRWPPTAEPRPGSRINRAAAT